MSRDIKLTLSFAILCVGLVTAFCLRTEPKMTTGLPRLENPQKIDRQIAEQQVGPYLSGLEEIHEAPVTRNIPKPDEAWAKPVFLQEEFEPIPEVEAIDIPAPRGIAATTPDPIPYFEITNDPPVKRPSSLPTPFMQEVTKPRQPAFTTHSVSQSSSREKLPTKHMVQPGETLTGIALKYYGDMRHFEKIFDANREQMRNPDSLRAGMDLFIPALHSEMNAPVFTAPAPKNPFDTISFPSEPEGPTALPPTRIRQRAEAPQQHTLGQSMMQQHVEESCVPDAEPQMKPIAVAERLPEAKPAPEPQAPKKFVAVRRSPFISGHRIRLAEVPTDEKPSRPAQQRNIILESSSVPETGKP
ncbi:LysM peptidoglycan-binding domain-containing protein [Calycomorphotria hydatis]|uniref:LysM domain/BON superfamily protein n=1 Tax=Calycomorphotria hydatis TaxID=2528027 RepID=A0A517TC92_9PLAN|nr:LysM peptidoglycan-binding domain-containing protein [Calycomorphotria hydatis]QDT65994.1 LysM domain/BON superfamily protein [Calycomorphotria hydatis]